MEKFNVDGFANRSKTLRSPSASGSTHVKASLYRRNSTRRTKLEKEISTQKTIEATFLDRIEEKEDD